MKPARPSPTISPCTSPAATSPRPLFGSITLSRAARMRSLSGVRGAFIALHIRARRGLYKRGRAARSLDHVAHVVQAFGDGEALLAHLVGGLEQVGHHHCHHAGGVGGAHAVVGVLQRQAVVRRHAEPLRQRSGTDQGWACRARSRRPPPPRRTSAGCRLAPACAARQDGWTRWRWRAEPQPRPDDPAVRPRRPSAPRRLRRRRARAP